MPDECVPAGEGETVVRSGDTVLSIATAAGLLPETVWNDPANAALKEARKDGEVLLPGDRLTVMNVRPKKVGCATGKRHVFRRKLVPATITFYVQDEEGAPFAAKRYELAIGATKLSGTTGDDGKIEAAIEPAIREGVLRVWLEEPALPNPWTLELRLGELVPVAHTIGVQQRLSNLGFYSGEFDVQLDDDTHAAVAAFQSASGLTVSGEIDPATRDKLVEIHKV
ncbi:MAG TPA: peptidoglycan-binding protein [Thermoanaerobaculia bacterium]|jgi:hypothetical protein